MELGFWTSEGRDGFPLNSWRALLAFLLSFSLTKNISIIPLLQKNPELDEWDMKGEALNHPFKLLLHFKWMATWSDAVIAQELFKFWRTLIPVRVAWHVNQDYNNLKQNISNFSNICVEIISREENDIADALANFSQLNPQLSLFSQGLEHPFCLKDICRKKHMCF